MWIKVNRRSLKRIIGELKMAIHYHESFIDANTPEFKHNDGPDLKRVRMITQVAINRNIKLIEVLTKQLHDEEAK